MYSNGHASMNSAVAVPDLSTTGGTIFVVGKQATPASTDINAPFLNFGTSQSISMRRAGSSASTFRMGANSTTGTKNNDHSPYADGTYFTLRLKVDNVNLVTAVNNGTPVSQACILGSFAGGTILKLFSTGSGGTYGDKWIAEVLIFNRALDSTETGLVETYLQDKYAHY